MKLFAKLMIAALFIAMALPFTVLKSKDGGTLLDIPDFEMPSFSLPDMPDFLSFFDAEKVVPAVDGLQGKDIVYEWKDAQGNIQFSGEPPTEGVEYTIRGYDPNTNVIQSVKMPTEESENVVIEMDGDAPDKTGDPGNPYSPEAIEKLFEDAKNVEKLMTQRLQQQESALNQ